jgi:hypothetical protein
MAEEKKRNEEERMLFVLLSRLLSALSFFYQLQERERIREHRVVCSDGKHKAEKR